ncbi:hypothetical protein COCON_G00023360 [Conger conger]|uniref:Uncharacterized protein n=1 Tax=Conger conger TaxID=82655 RepID=A0A9Q1I6F6_CONCO|nr:hypothetical protein COCON_G00023360 [Conger conger]
MTGGPVLSARRDSFQLPALVSTDLLLTRPANTLTACPNLHWGFGSVKNVTQRNVSVASILIPLKGFGQNYHLFPVISGLTDLLFARLPSSQPEYGSCTPKPPLTAPCQHLSRQSRSGGPLIPLRGLNESCSRTVPPVSLANGAWKRRPGMWFEVLSSGQLRPAPCFALAASRSGFLLLVSLATGARPVLTSLEQRKCALFCSAASENSSDIDRKTCWSCGTISMEGPEPSEFCCFQNGDCSRHVTNGLCNRLVAGSDSEYELDPGRQKTHSFVNHYISDPTYYNSWRRQQKGISRAQAYSYTDSAPRPRPPPAPAATPAQGSLFRPKGSRTPTPSQQSSNPPGQHSALYRPPSSLAPGSRAPIAGFSSFV